MKITVSGRAEGMEKESQKEMEEILSISVGDVGKVRGIFKAYIAAGILIE